MSSGVIASFEYATQQMAIYMNLSNLIIGIPGGLLNIIVFLSLKTFRESTCAFYLVIVSFANLGQLINGALIRLLISGYGIDWTISSRFSCKLRSFLSQYLSLISFTCLCLATIDQYFATSSRVRWQQWSNIKVVRILSIITVIFWALFSIFYAVYYDIVTSTSTNKTVCTNTNADFDLYNSYFQRNVLQGFLPNLLTAFFAVLAYLNTRNLAYRTVPLVRREHDKQLTQMLLVQVIVNFFSLLAYNIISIVIPNVLKSTDPLVLAKARFVQILSYSSYYFYTAWPFLIYVCVSERFRRQLAYVLVVKYLQHCPKFAFVGNQVVPDT
ncbi:unnamed protein product [Adineta ricciae]|uniref:G-protein coupled receptors family 1 profile domain-containing protein n=1 Tax=Adineta ricciae TaxID=249248 RepID=A0A814DV79_ADIRI|nr:unnamed protein product [Adineta ricciae]CAF0974756.1 unnamed protein product [Adineta ricciae]